MSASFLLRAIMEFSSENHAIVSQSDAMAIASAIHNHARQERLNPWIMLSLSWHESKWDLDATNQKTAAYGLFQLLPSNWAGMSAEQVRRPYTNARLAAELLSSYYRKAGHNTERMLLRFMGCVRGGKNWRKCQARVRSIEALAAKLQVAGEKSQAKAGNNGIRKGRIAA